MSRGRRKVPEIVETPQGRMVRTPAGGLIPEAQFLAMTTPCRPPSDEQLEAEYKRLGLPAPLPRESLRTLAHDLADFAVNSNHPLRQPTFDERVVFAGNDGQARRHEAETLALEQIAAAMRAGARRPSSIPQIGPLLPVHVSVAVEIGSEWLNRVPNDENLAISKVVYLIGVFHPEKAAKMVNHDDEIRNAIHAWKRGTGRPGKGEYKGSKWDAIAKLCKLVGIRDRDPATIKKAWQRSEKK